MLQVALMGPSSNFVVSGSDDGRAFIWERASGRLLNLLAADESAATVAVPNPVLPVLATGGSDAIIRLWAPTVPPLDGDMFWCRRVKMKIGVMKVWAYHAQSRRRR